MRRHPKRLEVTSMFDNAHYNIASNPYFKVMGFNRNSYFIYSWIRGEPLEYTEQHFTTRKLLKLAPLAFWQSNFPKIPVQRIAFNQLTAMSAMIRLANSRGLFAW
jgi:hypothetical protein